MTDTPNTHTASDAGLSELRLLLAALAMIRDGVPDASITPDEAKGFADAVDEALSASHTDAAAGWAKYEELRVALFRRLLNDALVMVAPGEELDALDRVIADRRMAGGEGTGAAGLTAEEVDRLEAMVSGPGAWTDGAGVQWTALGSHPDAAKGKVRRDCILRLIAAARAQAATAPAGGGETHKCGFCGATQLLAGAPAKPGQGDEVIVNGPSLDVLISNIERYPDLPVKVVLGALKEIRRAAPPADAALRSALEAIKGGHFPGASNYVLAGDWHGAFDQLQAIARAVLTTAAPADGAPGVEG